MIRIYIDSRGRKVGRYWETMYSARIESDGRTMAHGISVADEYMAVENAVREFRAFAHARWKRGKCTDPHKHAIGHSF